MKPRDIRSLDVGMLRTFDALMRERSVSRAAERLVLSQPAVSASLSRLREVFDDTLFARNGHGVTPTPRAQALAPQVQKVLAGIASLLEDERPFSPGASNRIFRIAGSDHASRNILPVLLNMLAEAGSGIRIVWEPPGSWSLPERLQRGDLDLAVIARIKVPREVESVSVYEDDYVYALRAGHPRAAEPITLDLFCEIPQVFLGYGSSTLDDTIDDILARSGRQRLAQCAVTSFGQIVHQLQHSDHAAVLGRRVAQAFGNALHVQPLPFVLPRYQALVCWSARVQTDPGIQWLRGAVMQAMQATL